MSAERAVAFKQALAEEMSAARPKIVSPATQEGYRKAAAQIQAAGAKPIFVVAPAIFQSPLQFSPAPPAPVIALNDAQKYPQFYDVKFRLDEGHIARAAAEDFCRTLAREFVRIAAPAPEQ
jgi:hypothetical protein